MADNIRDIASYKLEKLNESKKQLLELLDFMREYVNEGKIAGLFFVAFAPNGDSCDGLISSEDLTAARVVGDIELALLSLKMEIVHNTDGG